MCIDTYGTFNLATVAIIAGSNVPPDTSLTMWAPLLTAASATCALKVSIEMSTPFRARASITGRTRDISSPGGTGSAPGLHAHVYVSGSGENHTQFELSQELCLKRHVKIHSLVLFASYSVFSYTQPHTRLNADPAKPWVDFCFIV